MATQAQFNADPYQRREVVTVELDWLGDELCRRTGRPRTAAGTKGDRNHVRGAHRSQDFIKRSPLCTDRSYTVQSGLTATQERWIAGFDFTPGGDTAMIAQCKRIYAAMRAGRLNEVREFYGNINGDQVVDGWNNIEDRNASSDSSHLWHWHLSFDRRSCNNRSLMERVIAIALGDPEDDVTPADIEAVAGRTKQLILSDGGIQQLLSRAASIVSGANPAVPGTKQANALHQKLDVLATAIGEINEVDTSALQAQLAAIQASVDDIAALDADAIAAAIPDTLAAEVADLLSARLAA